MPAGSPQHLGSLRRPVFSGMSEASDTGRGGVSVRLPKGGCGVHLNTFKGDV